MTPSLYDDLILRGSAARLRGMPEFDQLSDRLLRDIGYTRDGRPIDGDLAPLPRTPSPSFNAIALALVLLVMH